MRSVSENQNTHVMPSNFFLSPENCAVCEIMWKNVAEPETPRTTIKHGVGRCDLHAR